VTDWLRQTFLSDNAAAQGPLFGYLNSLQPSVSGTGASIQATIASGGAYAYGFPYFNTAPVAVAIPNTAGNSRIDLIVLRVSWAAQTVRITRIAGVAAGSPAAPALTQIAGTTWDVPLCQILVNASGVPTLTDTRGFASFATRVLAENLADTQVSDNHIASRVPTMPVHFAGATGASEWGAYGNTEYIPDKVVMQCGAFPVSISAGNMGASFLASFKTGVFSAPPLVTCTLMARSGSYGTSEIGPTIHLGTAFPSTVSFGGHVTRSKPSDLTNAQTYTIFWIAIGPKA
jgi:hypothetical protein